MRHDMSLVLQQVAKGRTIKFYSNIFGERSVAFKTGWLFGKTVHVALEDGEIETVKDALRQRRKNKDRATPSKIDLGANNS